MTLDSMYLQKFNECTFLFSDYYINHPSNSYTERRYLCSIFRLYRTPGKLNVFGTPDTDFGVFIEVR